MPVSFRNFLVEDEANNYKRELKTDPEAFKACTEDEGNDVAKGQVYEPVDDDDQFNNWALNSEATDYTLQELLPVIRDKIHSNEDRDGMPQFFHFFRICEIIDNPAS